jgi:hypothetical protein
MFIFNHLDLLVKLVVLAYDVVQILEHLSVFVIFVHFFFQVTAFLSLWLWLLFVIVVRCSSAGE